MGSTNVTCAHGGSPSQWTPLTPPSLNNVAFPRQAEEGTKSDEHERRVRRVLGDST